MAVQVIHVYSDGVLIKDGRRYRCALGKGGVVSPDDKREGDGATPAALLPMRALWLREDRMARPSVALPIHPITEQIGWCEKPEFPDYNRPVTLPHPGCTEERLWREDHLYDAIVELGWNDDPVVPGKGSAIFMHLAREGYKPTAGCVALAREDLVQVLDGIGPQTMLHIHAEPAPEDP